jgi:hypothetical protein
MTIQKNYYEYFQILGGTHKSFRGHLRCPRACGWRSLGKDNVLTVILATFTIILLSDNYEHCEISGFHGGEYEDICLLGCVRIVGKRLQDYTAHHPRRQSSSYENIVNFYLRQELNSSVHEWS